MSKDMLTVSEVAEQVGVSKQAVYQRLNKDLNKYVKIVDSKKMLDISVLSEFVLKQVEQANSKELNNDLTSTLNTLNSVIDTLRQQLLVKDTQIKDLNNRLEQALNNQSQDNYLMAHQAKMIAESSASSEVYNEPGDTSSEQVHELNQSFLKKLFKRYRERFSS